MRCAYCPGALDALFADSVRSGGGGGSARLYTLLHLGYIMSQVPHHVTGTRHLAEHPAGHVADRMTDRMPDHMTDRMTDRMTDHMTDHMQCVLRRPHVF